MRTGMKTLHQDSILKCQEGVSTVLESISTVPPDMGVAVELEQTAAEKEAAAS
jgi:type IV pilus assembly protein PilB